TTRPPCGSASNAFWRRTATIAAVVDTFVRAIETSDFERRLQLVEADRSDHPGAETGMNGAGSGRFYNP
ncbi:MAG TPA: hypothetical protein VN849_12815, partial [Stellaceae bacterium]|nr:hypothetical protein [Stellaceae bacterium]